MNNSINKNHFKTIVWIITVFLFSGCADYFNDPLTDKDTGEEVNLFVIDLNFFNTSITYKLLDAISGEIIGSEAVVKFSGQNGNDIITFAGERKENFYTSEGQLELTVDPNANISESTPFIYTVQVEIEGYQTLTKGIQFFTEGKKTFELHLLRTEDEAKSDLIGNIDFGDNDTTFQFTSIPNTLKSANIEEDTYSINYLFTLSDLLKFKDANNNFLFNSPKEVMSAYNSNPENFVKISIGSYPSNKPEIAIMDINGELKSVLFQKLETGRLVSMKIGNTKVANLNGGVIRSYCNYNNEVEPGLCGFAFFENSSWEMLGKEVIYDELGFSYTFVKIIEDSVCETGATISFNSTINSGFSIDADLYDMDNNVITSINFKGDFPETFVLENIPWMPVKVVFRNNNSAFASIPPIEIEDLCHGDYKVDVDKNNGFTEYQIIFKALCNNNKTTAIAPSYNAEIKIKNSNDAWQGITMKGGVVNLLGKPDQEYQIRLLWENEWEYATFFTKFDDEGNYIQTFEPEDKIKSKILEDGRIQINIEKIFHQDICSDLGW